ncbi:DUF4143 domain-containing protein [Sphingobium sp. EM0848]|uniref:DUF4143 domain-containing protein n=1 Tax=Sphingobium sp. EM0848 TaxID=2743473 RepID=UPI00350F98A5
MTAPSFTNGRSPGIAFEQKNGLDGAHAARPLIRTILLLVADCLERAALNRTQEARSKFLLSHRFKRKRSSAKLKPVPTFPHDALALGSHRPGAPQRLKDRQVPAARLNVDRSAGPIRGESCRQDQLSRDGAAYPPETLRRFWTMLAHHQSGLLNASEFSRSLGVTSQTVANYLDLLVDLLLVRRLAPWHSNGSKRLVKSPRIYVRDSGLVHTFLGLADREAVLGHPVAGASWEGFVIENLLAAAPEGTEA